MRRFSQPLPRGEYSGAPSDSSALRSPGGDGMEMGHCNEEPGDMTAASLKINK